MEITPISNFIPFKSNIHDDENVLGFDDEISRERRNFIREHYNEYKMPYQSIYENEPRLGEYKLNQLIDFFAKKPKNITGEDIYHLPLSNVRRISNSSRYMPNIFRGSTLVDAPDWVIDKLKEAGIKTVIDLRGYSNSYKNKVEEHGLEYTSFYINPNQMSWYGIDKTSKKDDLIKFIKTMQKEYIYMGCEYGTYKTDAAVTLNTLFNPNVKGPCRVGSTFEIGYIWRVADELYKLMTPKDKKAIGWTPEFEKIFKEKIAKMLYR